MSSAWLEAVSPLALVLGLFIGCGGTSDGGHAAGAGANHGGSGGSAGAVGAAGASHGGTGTMNGGASAGEPSAGECSKADCGVQLGLANWTCADGSVGGPTGRCLRQNGGCGWEINRCPMAGDGGASSQGGQGNAGADSALGGATSEGCGNCEPGNVCVFQVGGPGPGRFVCAVQNPCGAAAACACVVGQGTCQPNLMGDPPGYCSCDNGLD